MRRPIPASGQKQKVVDLAKIVARYSGPIKAEYCEFYRYRSSISTTSAPHDELTIIMRRYMMRIAEHFAKEDKCLGLVTGESIGQVASPDHAFPGGHQ